MVTWQVSVLFSLSEAKSKRRRKKINAISLSVIGNDLPKIDFFLNKHIPKWIARILEDRLVLACRVATSELGSGKKIVLRIFRFLDFQN